jgi:hypothetical protein
MISVAIASCLNKPERKEYLQRQIEILRSVFEDKNIEILIGFDKYGCEIDGAKCYTHEKGLGHSWNWCLENASFENVLQSEDDWVIELNQERLGSKEKFIEYVENRIKVLDKFGGIFRFTNTDDQFWSPGKTKHILDEYEFLEANRPSSFKMNTWEMFYYSNQPHMKHKDLHKKVGLYKENAPAHEVEIDMCEKFFNSGERSFLNGFFALVHIGHEQSRGE